MPKPNSDASAAIAFWRDSRGILPGPGKHLTATDGQRHRFGLKYPCSYLIYSEPFDAMLESAKALVYARLWDILSGRVSDLRHAVLSQADREAILDILRETKPGLPAYFSGS